MARVRTTVITFAAAALVAAAAGRPTAQAPKPSAPADTKPAASQPAGSPHHVTVAAADIKWGPAPPSLPPGAQMGVLSGDPSKAEPFVMRGAKFPDGYRIQPHFHPTDENIVVLSGKFSVGMGDKFNESAVTTMTAGDYAMMPKTMRHYAMAKGETIIQVHGMGPFQVTYVNPSDDPRTKTKK